MKKNNPVLIVENCTSGLKPINESGIVKNYILSGIFTEFDIQNRNDRIYKADKFLPHMNDLLERKKQLTVIYGEFDHPDVFDTSLSRVSHTIESLIYNKEFNRVEGEIKLLNTHWGKEAKALVDDNCPIFVSSRAAGITESDGTVTVKKLFTYDAVADPGFSSARMEIKALNESLGLNNPNINFRIYDISDESKFNELIMENKQEFVTKQQMIEYSNYLSEQIDSISKFVKENVISGEAEPAELVSKMEQLENLQKNQSSISQYLDYLSEKIQILVTENVSLKEIQEKIIQHNDYLSESLQNSITYSEYVAEQVDKTIDYSEYIAESLDSSLEFSEYIAENVNKNIKYSEYVAEQVDKTIDYSEYIAENVENSIAYGEYIAENVENNIKYSEYLAEHVDNNVAYSEYVAEHVDNNIAYSEYIIEHLDNTKAYTRYIAESLDKTIDAFRGSKLFEGLDDQPDYKTSDINQYYDKDETEDLDQPGDEVIAQPGSEIIAQPGAKVQAQPGAKVQAQPGAEVQAQPGAEVQAQPGAETPQGPQPITAEKPSVEGQPVKAQGEIVPGMTVSVEDRPGEVIASNPENGIIVVKFSDNPEVEEPVQMTEKKVIILNSKLFEKKDIKTYIETLITETKKRKASEDNEPHFLSFLTEKNKKLYHSLIDEDREKVNLALNESVYYSESEIMRKMHEVLNPQKSFEDVLVEAIPTELKSVYDKLDDKTKVGLITSARLYPNLDTTSKMESFWYSKKMENYSLIKETKKLITENKAYNNDELSEEQLSRFLTKLKSL